MKEILQGSSQEAKMVEEATADTLEEANWGLNMRICNLLNNEKFDSSEVVRAIKKKISRNNVVSQRLSLNLLETCAMNCDKVFSAVASEKVLDEMVNVIDSPETLYANRRRAMQLIEAWGKSEDLVYLPMFRHIYVHKNQNYEATQLDLSGNDKVVSTLVEMGFHAEEASLSMHRCGMQSEIVAVGT